MLDQNMNTEQLPETVLFGAALDAANEKVRAFLEQEMKGITCLGEVKIETTLNIDLIFTARGGLWDAEGCAIGVMWKMRRAFPTITFDFMVKETP